VKCRLIRPKTDFRPLAKPIFETFESFCKNSFACFCASCELTALLPRRRLLGKLW